MSRFATICCADTLQGTCDDARLCFSCRNYKKYEEVRVPAVKTGGLAADEQLVQISDMEEWAQLAFEGYKCAPVLSCPSGSMASTLLSVCLQM